MDDLTRCLYEFTCARRMGSIYQDQEYEESLQSSDALLKRLQSGLDRDQLRALETLLETLAAQSDIRQEHLFQAALGLAREFTT